MAHYKELSPLLNGIIGGRFLRNKNLARLLFIYEPNSEKELPDNLNSLFMTHIYPMPKMPDAKTDKGAYVCAYFNGGYEIEDNKGYRNVVLNVDIICHIDLWFYNDSYRVYDIMAEIDSMLNNQLTDLPIEGTPYLRGFQTRVYTSEFYGVQMLYNFKINSTIECNTQPITEKLRSGMVYDPK